MSIASPSSLESNLPNQLSVSPGITSPRQAQGSDGQKGDNKKIVMASSLLNECFRGLSELQEAMSQMDETGLRLTQTLSSVLKDSVYNYVGEALAMRLSDVYTCAKSKAGLDIMNEMGSLLMKLQDLERQQKLDPDTYQHTLCHVALLLIKLKRQYYSVCSNRVADLVHSLLCLKGEEPAAGEVTKLVLKLGLADGLESPVKSNSSLPNSPWGSPKTKNKLISSSKSSSSSPHRPGFRIMSFFERKSPSEERSSFYVDVNEEDSNSRDKNQISSAISQTNASTTAASGENNLSKAKPGTTSTAASLAAEDKKNPKIADDSTSISRPYQTQPQISTAVALSSWVPQQSLAPPSSSLASVCDKISSSRGNNNNNTIQGQLSPITTTTTAAPPVDTELEITAKLASEEDLESIINLLSGMGPADSSPMQAIPEVPLLHMQGGPIQLVVPQIYRMPSPSSDTQVEELRSPSRQQQAHRRSEGCLDLSAMRPSSIHHHHQHLPPPPPPHLQQQLHHHQPRFFNTQQPPPPLSAAAAANLPWVQIQSASSHGSISAGSISDCPSPLSGYTAGDSSPGYAMSPSPSFPSSPARLPVVSSSINTAVAPNSLGVGGGVSGSMSLSMSSMRGRSLSPFQHQQQQPHQHQQLQHWGGVGSGGGGGMFLGSSSGTSVSPGTATAPGAIGGGGSSPRPALTPEFGQRKQGTWPPTYGGGSAANQMNLGWSGIQDSSDLSDDSSTEDQFFHVGTDLCHALDSKGDSSDEESFSGYQGQAKNSSTWPLPNIAAGVSEVVPNRGLTPDLLEPPDLYQQQSHRPVQMQWSDPMSSRSEWPARSLDPSQRKTSQSMYGFGGMP